MAAIDYDRAVALRAQGLSYRECAQILGVNDESLKVGFCRLGLNRKVKEVTQKSTAWIAVKTAQTLDALQADSKDVRSQLSAITKEAAQLLGKTKLKSIKALANTSKRQGVAAVLKTIVESSDTLYGWSDQKIVGVIDARSLESACGERPAIDVQAQQQLACGQDTPSNSVPALPANDSIAQVEQSTKPQ